MPEHKRFTTLLKVGLLIIFVVLGFLLFRHFQKDVPVMETPVRVVEMKPSEQGIWSVPKNAVAAKPDLRESFVTRLKYLRAEQLNVKVIGRKDNDYLLQSNDLKLGDVLVLKPEVISSGQAVVPVEGLTEEKLIGLVLDAGMAAAMSENLDESVRFISHGYRDGLSFNKSLMRELLKRAYKEFDSPLIELAEPPVIRVQGNKAIVKAKVRVSATYRGRRNYLLGDRDAPNEVLLKMDKSVSGWKVSSVEGLKPLGFEEKFLRFLGTEIGLSLSKAEQEQMREMCMPCRQRMAERFGSGR